MVSPTLVTRRCWRHFPDGNARCASIVFVFAWGRSAPPPAIASDKILPSNLWGESMPRICKIVGARSMLPVGRSSTNPCRKSGPAAMRILCKSNLLRVAWVPFPAARFQSALINPATPNAARKSPPRSPTPAAILPNAASPLHRERRRKTRPRPHCQPP